LSAEGAGRQPRRDEDAEVLFAGRDRRGEHVPGIGAEPQRVSQPLG
jgi:hypothetical protein